jgi:excisionase family DNA binding protein
MKKDSRNRLTLSTQFSDATSASEDWISQAEAARIRRVSRQAISRLIKKGRFHILKIGGKVLLKRSEVKAYEPEQAGRPHK